MENFDETFLARWNEGKLTKEEHDLFKKHPDYESYVTIKKASSLLSFSKYNENKAYNEISKQLVSNKKTSKVISLYKYVSGVAAAILLILGITFFINQPTKYSTSVAENSIIILPDGSEMNLNSNSKAFVNSKQWEENRLIELEGEAYFKVKKGSKFTVQTSKGKVQVLGTQFNVNASSDEFLSVTCYEGIVSVVTNQINTKLYQGMAVQQYNDQVSNWKFSLTDPSWITRERVDLYKVPVNQLLLEVQKYHNVKFQNIKALNKSLVFTGSFTTKDLNKAIKHIFTTLEVDYEFINTNEIRILD